jgi:hypothetical protein
VGEAINPTVGYGTGFLNSLTSTLANVGNITLAGTYLLFVITPTHTFAKPITWLVATAIIGSCSGSRSAGSGPPYGCRSGSWSSSTAR